MANALSTDVPDQALAYIRTKADKIYLCTQDPTTYTEATSTYALASKNLGAGNCFGAPGAGSGNNRKISSVPFVDGSVTASGTATKWAVVDSAVGDLLLLAHGSLAASLAVVNGNLFTLGSFDIAIPTQ